MWGDAKGSVGGSTTRLATAWCGATRRGRLEVLRPGWRRPDEGPGEGVAGCLVRGLRRTVATYLW